MKQKPIEWPGQARIAVSMVLNVEAWTSEQPSRFNPAFPPGTRTDRDFVTITEREYAYRAGLPRLLEILDRHEAKLTAVVSGLAAERYPEAIREIRDRGHEVAGHSYDQSVYLVTLTREQEEEVVRRSVDAIEKAVGSRPVGWLSPGYRCTEHTSALLAAAGFLWHADTLADDLPYVQRINGRPLVMVPYSNVNNDYRLFMYGSPPLPPRLAFEALQDEFDQLYDEGGRGEPKMMSYGLHPYVTGRAGRARAFDRFLRYIRGFPGVWIARRDEIARWWLERYGGEGR